MKKQAPEQTEKKYTLFILPTPNVTYFNEKMSKILNKIFENVLVQLLKYLLCF